MAEPVKLTITMVSRLKKYAPGDDPETSEPIEETVKEEVLTGAEARKFLAQLKGE